MKFATTCFIALAMLAISAAQLADDALDIDQVVDESQARAKRASFGKNFDIQVVKKPGRVRQIHLYPYAAKQKEDSTQPPLIPQEMYAKAEEQDAADSSHVENVSSGKEFTSQAEAVTSRDNVGSDSHTHYIKEQKEKIKIKHHHHHHHHNHVKTVVKKQPFPVEKIVHVPKPYPVEKVVEKVVHVPVHKIVEVPKPYPVEKIVEKLVHVPKPYPVKEYIEKKVPYPVEKVVEKIVHVPKPYPYPVIKHVEVPIKVPIPYEVEKKVPYPVKVPYEVEKKVPYPVKIYVPHPVPHPVPVLEKPHHHHHHEFSHLHHHTNPHLAYANHLADYDHHKADQTSSGEQAQAQQIRSTIYPKKAALLQQQQLQQQQLQHQQQQQQQQLQQQQLQQQQEQQQQEQQQQQQQQQQYVQQFQRQQQAQQQGQQQKLLQQQKQAEQQRLYQQYQQKLQFSQEEEASTAGEASNQVHNVYSVEHDASSSSSSSDFQPIIGGLSIEHAVAASNNVQHAVAAPHSSISNGNINPFQISIPDQLPQPEALVMEPTRNPGVGAVHFTDDSQYYQMQSAALETPKGFSLSS